MSNYDYNKGYRWFRFQKDSSIDSSLPPLCSYRSMREVSPLLWMTNAEHVANNERGHVHSHQGGFSKSNDTASLHLPIILAASISNVSNAAPSVDEGSNAVDMGDDCTERVHTDTLAYSLYVPTPTVMLGSETGQTGQAANTGAVIPHQFGVKRTPVHKTRTKRAARKPAKDRPNLGSQKNLEDCLFIQNGIQRFPTSHKRFLSAEKEKDIKEWINGSNKS